MTRAGGLVIIATLVAGCSTLPRDQGPADAFVASPSFNDRRANFVVIHYTASSEAVQALATLTDPQSDVSAHYLIEPDGKTVQLVDERRRAWHAGVGRWGQDTDLNSSSIGIELVNDGKAPFPDAQVNALIGLLRAVRARNRIPPSHVIGHADLAPTRKADPGPLFPWRRLAQAGEGIWCDPPFPPAPAGFDALTGLALLGYDVRDPAAAVQAFRLHFGSGAALDPNQVACLLAARERLDASSAQAASQ